MHPELLRFGAEGPVLHAYGVFLGLAIVLGAWLGVRNASRDGFPVPQVLLALALGVPAGFLGARLQYAAVDPAAFDGVLDLLDFREGRFYSFGAAAGGLLGTAAAARLLGLKPLAFVERLMPGLALGLAVGRVGCFLAGCGFGAPTSLAWGVAFPPGSPAFETHAAAGLVPPDATSSLAVHPTQLIELTVLLALAVVLQLRLRARPRAGAVLLAFAASYCLMRLGVEHLRGDASRGTYGPLSATQWAAAGTLVLLVAYEVRAWVARGRSLASESAG